ncbi:uncharacterized protein LOC113005852 [Solenopsis invicta]|uniref:uncharacterized protein LOC113005852 n=1 Tax=Solenopsis invicta TaxID=13686 RepID=UPI00193DA8E0|nr:uncharacterized protein LOC113005852 [Solenopsis invicta]
MWDKHPSIMETSLKPWCQQFFRVDTSNKIHKCVFNNCNTDLKIFRGTNTLEEHLAKEHEIVQGRTVKQEERTEDTKIWQYFKNSELSIANCNLCSQEIKYQQMAELEFHIEHAHPKIIKEVENVLLHGNDSLKRRFNFNGKHLATCEYGCQLSIFRGLDNFLCHYADKHQIF